MDTSFLLGIIVAVPLSIAANLATPKVGALLAARSEAGKLRTAASKKQRQAEIELFADDPHLLTQLMLRQLIGVASTAIRATAGYGSLLILISANMGLGVAPDRVPQGYVLAIASLAALLGGLAITQGARQTLWAHGTLHAVRVVRAQRAARGAIA